MKTSDLLCIACSVLMLSCAALALAQEETIVAIRHGEKPVAGLGQLTCQGLNRALALPKVLVGRYGKPDLIYAPNPAEKVTDANKVKYFPMYVRWQRLSRRRFNWACR